ncbi:B12-binding domain-containing radical SAM protein [Acidobacteria bacterium AH-259-D05]|nr:B12-binding domain-containing radical SAM protein [Acidobacteria bacterium AH-259-D05]
MNILLIRGKPTFMDMIVGIPIGLVYIAPIAEQKGHHVEILDLALEGDPDPVLSSKLKERRWDLIGISCMTAEFEGAENVARGVKEFDPEIKIIFGGQHPTMVMEEVLTQPYCDFLCVGEGEETFGHLLDVLSSGGDLSQVLGLAYKDQQGETRNNPPRPQIQEVDLIPFPAYHLLDLDRYVEAESARYTAKYKRAIQIFSSRGCPWHCTYCHDLFGKTFRPRSPENVLAEMKMLYYQYHIREFMVEDDIFNFDMDRAKKICDLIVEEGLQIGMQFGNGVRLERFDEELMEKLAAAGTHHLCIAIESASPRIQSLTRKNLKLHMVKDVVGWAKKYKIHVLGFFMMGFPTETVEEINMTIRFACQTDLDEALFSIVIPYAGTQLAKQVVESGLYDRSYTPDLLHEVVRIKTPDFDFKTLKRLQRKGYMMFFLTRFRFVKMLPKLLNFRSSKRYIKAIERHFFPEFITGAASRTN